MVKVKLATALAVLAGVTNRAAGFHRHAARAPLRRGVATSMSADSSPLSELASQKVDAFVAANPGLRWDVPNLRVFQSPDAGVGIKCVKGYRVSAHGSTFVTPPPPPPPPPPTGPDPTHRHPRHRNHPPTQPPFPPAQEAGEVLMEIPWSACLGVERALADPTVGDVLKQLKAAAGPGSELVILAAALGAAKLRHDAGVQGEIGSKVSGFEDYAASLDWESEVGGGASHISRWDSRRLATLMAEAPEELRDTADDLQMVVEYSVRDLSKVLAVAAKKVAESEAGWFGQLTKQIQTAQAGGALGDGSARQYEEMAVTAMTLVLTRVFDPPPPGRQWGDGGDEGPALIPLLDILNHAKVGLAYRVNCEAYLSTSDAHRLPATPRPLSDCTPRTPYRQRGDRAGLCTARYDAGGGDEGVAVRVSTLGTVVAGSELRHDYGHGQEASGIV